MDTPIQDRFANLFTNGPTSTVPDTNQPCLFEIEQEQAQQTTSWKSRDVAQTPHQVPGPAPRPAGGADVLTSDEDEDDCVAAFARKSKPKMLTSKKKISEKTRPRQMPEANAFGYPKDAYIEAKAPIRYISKGKSSDIVGDRDDDGESTFLQLPTSDKFGNSATGSFCQFNLVKTFPYKYMDDGNDRVSRHFFANNKFFERTWDLYYIHPPESLYRPVLLLLPVSQVKQLIEEIATTFKTETSVPSFPFTISFFDDGTPQPQLLGTTKSRADLDEMQGSIPSPLAGHGESPDNASEALDHSFAAFKRKLDKAVTASKKKAAAGKKKKAQDRFTVIQDWHKQLRRAQRYLGIRPRSGQVPVPDPDMAWAEQQAFIAEHEHKARVVLDPLDVNKITPFPFEEEAIIISIDIESFERNHNLITEIGISTLDTLDLVDIVPGEGGENWMKQIRSRHFRISGREHLVNKDFVHGNAENFQFGTSEFVTIGEAGNAIDSCFEWPFSDDFKHDGRLSNFANWECYGTASTTATNATEHDEPIEAVTPVAVPAIQKGGKQRTMLLLGHDLGSDLAYLSTTGSRVFSAPRPTTYPRVTPEPGDEDNPVHSILEALDTATLYRSFTRDTNTRSLTAMMGDLGRTAWYAHCGGNDARYTLEALVGLVIKARIQDDEEKAARKDAMKKALEKDDWSPTPTTHATDTSGKDAAALDDISNNDNGNGHDQFTQTNNPDIASNGTDLPPAWVAEKARRMEDRLAATRKEVEDEHDAWDALITSSSQPPPAVNTAHVPTSAQPPAFVTTDKELHSGGTPVPFSQTLQSTHDAKAKKAAKKTAEEKRREWEMKVREEDQSGEFKEPVDWGVGGKDGFGK